MTPPQDLRCRRATPEDLPALLALLPETFQNPLHYPTSRDAWERDLREQIAEGALHVAVDAEGRIVGTGALEVRAHLRRLATAPDARGTGVGAAMMRHLEEEAARAGARTLTLSSDEEQPPLTRFYERAGFRSVGVLHLHEGERYHQFRKRLATALPEDVRRATLEDAAALSAFFQRAYQENEKLGLQYWAPAVQEEVVRHLILASEVYVREREGRIVAAVALTPLAEVRRLSVDPAERGLGHARALMAFALARARALGAAEARLEIDAGHPFLARFYEDLGFVELGTMAYDPGTEDEFRSRWFARPLRGDGSGP